MQTQTKVCQNCKKDFVIEPEDFNFYEKIKVPPPSFCPECRLRRRLAFRNERFLFKIKCAFSGKEIFSTISPDADAVVYENAVWFSDKWDPLDYGQDFDFSRPFFEQLNELLHKVPLYAQSSIFGVNSEYSSNYTALKNCYLVFNSNYSENCAYSTNLTHSRQCIDCSFVGKSENCYECFWLNSCANCFWSVQCHDSYNLYFSKSCVGCNDCFGCVNLRNKKYCLFNQSLSKEEYQEFLRKFNSESQEEIQKWAEEAKKLWSKNPVRFMEGVKNANVSGEYIHNCKNVRDSYMAIDTQDSRYTSFVEKGPVKDCYDYSAWGNGAELIYESSSCGLGVNGLRFCYEMWSTARNAEYSLFCVSSSDIFGCVGLHNKQFCIFNKQYSETEYKKLRQKIIAHMNDMPYRDKKGNVYTYGEFFPPMLSLYAHNKTMAEEFFPKGKDEALEGGYFWEDLKEKDYKPTIRGSELVDNNVIIKDNVLKEIILCASWEQDPQKALLKNCSKAFRIIESELQFYRRLKIPLPLCCHNCRHHDRNLNRQPMQLWDRKCMCEKKEHGHKGRCSVEFETSYAPERPEIVYCEKCYQKEVY
ncbi:MAG: hypothetical protein UU13_C0001G0003 [Candidatus Nomurabacteria bacterium GW2011_GWB1_40_7]|uniref:Uncharacterized protein n=1 Tax=Candidatus Nomurabacteria bacterium GW2011_GWB1_40_7 TaxID=1618744 RepID=A0A0G0VFF1_9BACT|nr:MAG: hypothetical protein UU13_C0001G0003 [Candidatus Nomurabacteria bacterium GW2011_GWB1_40_7]